MFVDRSTVSTGEWVGGTGAVLASQAEAIVDR